METLRRNERHLPSFWSPILAEDRKKWFKMTSLFMVLLTAIIFGILSIYWGAVHSLQFNLDVATVTIIDLDGGEIGQAIQAFGQASRSATPKDTLGYVSPGVNQYPTQEAALKALQNEDFWVGIVAVPGATDRMNTALTTGNNSYKPNEALQVLYQEGRNALIISELILPKLTTFLNEFVSNFTTNKQSSLLQQNEGNAAALATQLRTPIPVGFTLVNKAPYMPTTAEASTEIGSIYIIIASFITVIMFEQLFLQLLGKVGTRTFYLLRMAALPVIFLLLSAIYLLLSVVWQVPFDRHYGTAGYVIYWLLSWCGMISFGLTISNVNDLIGQPFTAVFFVFWVVSNVTAGFYPIEFLSNFYRWGLAWPFRHLLTGSKAVIFGTKNTLGLNFGVIIAWIAVGLLVQPLAIFLWMRKNKARVEQNRNDVLKRTKDVRQDTSSISESI
ncbi:hypothetical protein BCR37DRAFT_271048 [Protomyces lactucae-debilis]|uniref:DUF3533 domain-containing protein n=1 Tax=Protomyces lactucae-debilis TaxID=2754530 RepID=A0A1Y2FKN7_PROLT|nr:uncharacterized protein BCR37DRAFT_271048 [Protomyces lactucae-debilis]ORY84489.1 hypothetical protein BCR37DRAFT_271048 [Protomyces lactucae-debilis]